MKRFLIFYFIVTGILLLIDYYVFQGIKSATRDWSLNAKRNLSIIYWSVTVISLLAFLAVFFFPFEKWPRPLRSYLFSSIMLIYSTKLIMIPLLFADDVTRIARWVMSLFGEKNQEYGGFASISRSKFLSQAAMLMGGVPLALGIHGMLRNAYNYKIHRVKVTLPHLPDAFNGLKIVQISDIHSGSFAARSPVEKGIELINAENPDLVFFTGDIVNYHADEMLEFTDVFNKIQAKEGVYSVFGNHDYADYIRYSSKDEMDIGKLSNREKMINIHRNMGWNLLLNENKILSRGDSTLAIIGSENWSANFRFKTYGDLEKACNGCETADVKLLLSHDPTHWDAEVTQKFPQIDVTFSGHTHGAQLGVEIPGFLKWSPAQYLYKQWAGLYENVHQETGKNQFLYVNRGFGFIGFHGRIGIMPEITVMELVKG